MDGRPGERETREYYRRQRRKSTGARAESKVGRHGETSCAGVGKRAREAIGAATTATATTTTTTTTKYGSRVATGTRRDARAKAKRNDDDEGEE